MACLLIPNHLNQLLHLFARTLEGEKSQVSSRVQEVSLGPVLLSVLINGVWILSWVRRFLTFVKSMDMTVHYLDQEELLPLGL